MDYVDWCGAVLTSIARYQDSSSNASLLGVFYRDLASVVFEHPESISNADAVAVDAANDLESEFFLQDNNSFLKVTQQGQNYLVNPIPYWESICSLRIRAGWEEVLRKVNHLSAVSYETYAEVNPVSDDDLRLALEWSDSDWLYAAVSELESQRLVGWRAPLGGTFKVWSTLRGLVWQSRRGITLETVWMDEKVREWETTSVEFKQDVNTRTMDEKAELVKDILGLANTQASGRRWLLIGFNDKTRQYAGPPNPKLSQDHLEQLMSVYTQPVVELRYDVVEFRSGLVGKVEVLRDGTKLPYSVAKSVGDKKRIEQSEVFVRHGSQTEKPTPMELQSIQDEGTRARESIASEE